jgi:HNH endonuclease
MDRVTEVWERDGGHCVWCSAAAWPRDRTVEHLLPRSRGGGNGLHNLLPACRACNRARRSQSAVAYARGRAADGRAVGAGLLERGLDRLARQGDAAERRYGERQARMVRDWRASEAAVAAHAERFAAVAPTGA